MINSLLPLIRNFALELKAREEAMLQPEQIQELAFILDVWEKAAMKASFPQNPLPFGSYPARYKK